MKSRAQFITLFLLYHLWLARGEVTGRRGAGAPGRERARFMHRGPEQCRIGLTERGGGCLLLPILPLQCNA